MLNGQGDELAMQQKDSVLKRHRLAIFAGENARAAPSETFIRAHFERLDCTFEVIPIFGGGWLLADASGKRLWPRLRYAMRVIGKLSSRLDGVLFCRVLATRLKRMRVDAILAEYGPIGAGLVESANLANIPLFVIFWGYDASRHAVLEAQAEGYTKLFQSAEGIVGVSRSIVSRLGELGAPAERLYFDPGGVDPAIFCGATPEKNLPIFLAVGRFVEKKAPHLTVLAFREVLNGCPEARLKMVGAGPLLGPTKRLAAALGVAKQVEFLGVQPPTRVAELMRQARAFVQHSLEAEDGNCEGTPNAVMEAQMSGLPVVSTLHAGIPDVVVEGETGFLVAEGDAVGMGERMLRLALDPELAGRLGRNGGERALRHFTVDRHLRQLVELIERAVRRRFGEGSPAITPQVPSTAGPKDLN